MTATAKSDNRGGIRWVSFRNDAEEDMPAFAVMRITGIVEIDGEAVLKAQQPNANSGTGLMFNSSMPVKKGGYGSCTAHFPAMAYFDSAATPAVGEEWGAKANSWKLTKGYPGFFVLGRITGEERMLVMPTMGTILAKADGNASAGAEFDCSLHAGYPATDTGLTVRAFTPLGSVEMGKWVVLSPYYGGILLTIATECDSP